jgi:hypothetical protein
VAVRGPGEADFTALAPRQRLSATSTAPDSTSAPPSCPHDHIGEVWVASVPWANGAFKVTNNQNGPSVWGANTGGGNAVRGDGYGNSIGVYGDGDNGPGVVGRSANGWGVEAHGKDDGPFTNRKGDLLVGGSYGDIFAPGFLRLWSDDDIYVTIDADNDNFNGFTIFNGTGSSVFNVNESGDLWAAGNKSARVETANHGPRLVYALESPEVWLEDFGAASLANGKVIVPIEPIFAETVNLEAGYHVFLTPLGDCKGLYVAAKTPTSFEVRELGGGTANIGFDYRIVAKRQGFENTRLEPSTVPASRDGKEAQR